LRSLLDAASSGLLALDDEGIIVEANTAAAALLGHERKRLLGKPLAALVTLDDRRSLRRELGRLESRDVVTLELRSLSDEQPLVFTFQVVVATPRRVAVAINSARERQQTQQRQHEGSQTNEFILRFPSAVVALDPESRVLFANPRARTILGPDVIRKGTDFGSNAPTELRAIARRLVRFAAPLRPFEVTLADARVLRVSGVAATRNDPALLFVEDVSAHHRQERIMREFLRNAAHQLRTPLAGITAAVETLQSGAKDQPENRDRFLAHVERHAERLTRLARGLLMLARTQAGEDAPIDFVELRPLVEQLVADAEPRDGVGIRVDCEPGLATLASPELLGEALAALLGNALDHTRAGEVVISAARLNGRVALTVTDTGPGILPEFVDRVFEPFFRLSPSGEGYGLGLAIAAEAVHAMGGDIDVSSVVGGGSSFTMRLPSATLVG
jgi:PAS domain S-box-containing protein